MKTSQVFSLRGFKINLLLGLAFYGLMFSMAGLVAFSTGGRLITEHLLTNLTVALGSLVLVSSLTSRMSLALARSPRIAVLTIALLQGYWICFFQSGTEKGWLDILGEHSKALSVVLTPVGGLIYGFPLVVLSLGILLFMFTSQYRKLA